MFKPKIGIVGDTVLCGGETVVLDAGAGMATYLWSTGESTQKITVSQAGTYYVHVADAGGCSGNSDTVTVSVGQNLVPTITGNDTVCANTVAGYATARVAGRTYQWTITGGSITSGAGTDSITVLWGNAGTGTVAVQVASGTCTGGVSQTVFVSNGALPVVTAGGPLTFCIGDSVVLSTSAGYATYRWSDGSTTPSITVRTSGTFTVDVSDATGCTGTSAPVTVTVGDSLLPVITGTAGYCPGGSTTLDAGAGYATYRWSTGETTQTIIVSTPVTVRVVVTKGSCGGTSNDLSVVPFPQPTVTITVSGNTLTASPAAATYQWSLNGTPIGGATSATLVMTLPGDYTVAITDANGCGAVSAPYTYTVAPATAIVTVGAVPKVGPGSSVDVPIVLVSSQNLAASNANHYMGSLRYNGTMLMPKSSRGGTLGASAAVAGSTDRIVAFEGFSAPSTAGTLQWIQCDALLGNDTCATVAIDTFYWTDAAVGVARQSATFCESGICITGGTVRLIDASGTVALQPGRPNPATDEVTIEYDIVETGPTRLVLSDMMGRAVQTVRDGFQKAGHYTVRVPLTELTTGCYMISLTTPSQLLHQLVIVRK